MWQEIIVYALLIMSLAYVVRAILRQVKGKSSANSCCASKGSGCDACMDMNEKMIKK